MVWGPAPAAGGGCSDVSIRKVSFMPSTPASCNGHRRRQAPQRLSATESGQSTRSVDRPVGHCALCIHCVLYMVHYALCIVQCAFRPPTARRLPPRTDRAQASCTPRCRTQPEAIRAI